MRIKGYIVAAGIVGLLIAGLVPATPVDAAESDEFYAWGTIVRRDYGPEDYVGGALNLRSPNGPPVLNQLQEPNAVRIDVAGGTPNALAFRDRGATLRIATDNADWRHGTTFDYPGDWSNPPVGAVFEFVGRVDTNLDGSKSYVAEIARPHQFEVAEHQDNIAEMTYVETTIEEGDDVQTYEGTVTSGPLSGWTVAASVHCILDEVTWTATNGADSLSGADDADWDPESFSGQPFQLFTKLDGGTGAYAAVTGGARFRLGCDDLAPERNAVMPHLVELELDIAV